MGDVGADGKGHGEAQDIQARGHHPGAAHAEEAAEDAHPHPKNDQTRPKYLDPRNGHENIQPVHKLTSSHLQVQCSASSRDFRSIPIRLMTMSARSPKHRPTTGMMTTVTRVK